MTTRISLRLLVVVLGLLMLAACTQASPIDHGTVLQRPLTFKTGAAWVRELNWHGIPCRLDLLGPSPRPTFPYVDTARCRLLSGDSLNVWIVMDSDRTYQAHFRTTREKYSIFYRDNWLATTPSTVPAEIATMVRVAFDSNASGLPDPGERYRGVSDPRNRTATGL
jgi:hypothetical protein